ncbi:MAG: hypothetical protein GM48_0145 [actinobacterium acIB-AMD-7]|nr:MAG: hypothetical protein GM48_0145 [actinobacterium acIB-AMD-7]
MEKKSPLICVILTTQRNPYFEIRSLGQEKTWTQSKYCLGTEIFYAHGNVYGGIGKLFDNFREHIRLRHGYISKLLGLFERIIFFPFMNYIPKYKIIVKESGVPDLQIQMPDFYITLRWKLLVILDYFINKTDKDYILITTTSSYIRFDILIKYLSKLPKNNLYFGSFPWVGAKFISGSNRLISRDVAKKILTNRKLWRPDIIEDVEMGNLLQSIGIHPLGKPLVNLDTMAQVNSVPLKVLNKNYHFRLKSGSRKNRLDIQIMNSLHERITKL